MDEKTQGIPGQILDNKIYPRPDTAKNAVRRLRVSVEFFSV